MNELKNHFYFGLSKQQQLNNNNNQSIIGELVSSIINPGIEKKQKSEQRSVSSKSKSKSKSGLETLSRLTKTQTDQQNNQQQLGRVTGLAKLLVEKLF